MENSVLKDVLLKAKAQHYAIGAFNIFNHLTARAVLQAAEELEMPVIIQTSVSTVREFGPPVLIRMLRSLTDFSLVPVLIHLDHCTDPDLAKTCIDAGWDSVMIDGSHLTFTENIRITREIVRYAHKKAVCVEGEIGVIAGVEDNVAASLEKLAAYDDCLAFINSTGIDALAPAIGTAHGQYLGTPVINDELIRQLSVSVNCPLVIHGGTGLSDATFARLIRQGAAKINVSTAIKQAYLGACADYFRNNPVKTDPLSLDRYITAQVKQTVQQHMTIFRQQKAN